MAAATRPTMTAGRRTADGLRFFGAIGGRAGSDCVCGVAGVGMSILAFPRPRETTRLLSSEEALSCQQIMSWFSTIEQFCSKLNQIALFIRRPPLRLRVA